MKKHKYGDLLPPLSREEFDTLRRDIKANGVLHPVFVDENGDILDGWHRIRIHPDAPRKVIRGLSEAEKRAFVIRCNFVRRNLSPEQKEEARKRQKQIAFALRDEDAKKWTQREVAKTIGVDHTTVSKWFSNLKDQQTKPDARLSLGRDLTEEIVQRVDDGEKQKQVAADIGVTEGRVSQILTREKKRAEAAAQVEEITRQKADAFQGLYDVIVIDPPWPMEKIDREVHPEQAGFDYPTMTEEELAEFALPMTADCHVWCWTTQKFLPMCLRLLEGWGLKYVCTFVWHKNGGFQPFGLPQYNCEFAVYARRGAPKFTDTKQFSACFSADRTGHSQKPEAFYRMIHGATDGRRIDIFSRRGIHGFDSWGNEAGVGD